MRVLRKKSTVNWAQEVNLSDFFLRWGKAHFGFTSEAKMLTLLSLVGSIVCPQKFNNIFATLTYPMLSQ